MCDYLRADALVAHPSLLTWESDGISHEVRDLFEMPIAAGVRHEVWHGITWPQSVDEVRSAVEQGLSTRFGSVTVDDDDDFVVINSGGGSRFYLTVID